MCSHYEAPLRKLLQSAFPAAAIPGAWDRPDMWPTYVGPFVRRPVEADPLDEAVAPLVVETGNFGLIPAWSRDENLGRRTYNARSETVAEKPTFRDAWRRGQRCIVPAAAIYEADWRSGRAVSTRISRADGEPLGIAGLYARRRTPAGGWAFSFTMLTLNADAHPIFRELHRPDPALPPDRQDKRMVAILPRGLYAAWLDTPQDQAMDFMRMFPAHRLRAEAATVASVAAPAAERLKAPTPPQDPA